ncbi:MAG: competence/damage-inducible protein A [bacterium]|nr:competence/damage-inducible protein A [bacterium]
MRAIFIAVGSEMLERDFIDTNSLYVQKGLMDHGILMDMKVVIRDEIDQLSWIVKNACKRTQLVVITGGLGPTEDDLTREAVADALKKDLIFKESLVADLEERFRKRGMKMPEINTRQAFVIDGSEVLYNPLGSAPGLYLDDENCRVLLLPGPPHEMKPMFDRVLKKRIAPLSNFHIYKRSMKFSGTAESSVDAMIAELYTKYRNPKTTILATPGVIEVHLLGRSKKTVEEAKEVTDELAEKIKERLKDLLLTEKDISIEEYILEELRAANLTLSVAESCTGGGIGNRITNVPGSSDIFLGGVIAYSNSLKMKLLGVKEKTLVGKGAVSKETAKEMARGIREATGSDIGIAVTGIAGPGGASKNKPVGLVFMHLSAKDAEMGLYRIFPGEREMVKKRTVNYSLNLIKEYLKTREIAG